VPKNEREWWASRTIEKLERELAETERLRFGADADRRQLRCELTAAKEECEELLSVNATGAERLRFVLEENSRLRAEVTGKTSPIKLRLKSSTYASKSARAWLAELDAAVARAEKAEADNAKWQKLLLMSRDDREIDLISEIEEQARLLGMSGEREADLLGKLGRLESELAAIKNGHGELGKYEQLRLKNAELQAELAAMKGTP
jgi:septal ring factor EnvC (AmiA/AmiB activator)